MQADATGSKSSEPCDPGQHSSHTCNDAHDHTGGKGEIEQDDVLRKLEDLCKLMQVCNVLSPFDAGMLSGLSLLVPAV